MSLSDINTQINSILSGVTGIGTKIYNYDVYADDWSTFLSKFKNTGDSKVNGWCFYRQKTDEETHSSRTNIRRHTYIFRGFYSLGTYGSTMTSFQDLLELIATAFRNKPSLNGVALITSAMQINVVENRQFGEVLCHYAELMLGVEEEEQWTE
jgi:hypothetical protein